MSKDNVFAFSPAYGESLDEDLLERVAEAYGVGDCLVWSQVRTSAEPSYLLRARSGDYILRRAAPYRTAGSLTFEMNLTHHLHEQGYPVLDALSTRSGSSYFRHGGIFYTLAASRQGELFDFFDFEDEEHLLAAARGLAAYHRAVAGYPGPYYLSSTPYLSASVADGLATLQKMRDRIAPAQRKLVESLDYATGQLHELHRTLCGLYRREAKTVTHGSFDDQCLWFESGQLVNVDNFSHASLDIKPVDIAQSIIALCGLATASPDEPHPQIDCARSKTFLRAYAEVAHLSDVELEAVSTVLRARRLVETLNDCKRTLHDDPADLDAVEPVRRIESRLALLRHSKCEATALVTAWTA